jgi:dTDP-4-dehydrorhamnose reductase
MPRLLIIGRAGQLAQGLFLAAPDADHAATALGRPDFDLTDPAAAGPALARHRPDLVINAAAYTAVDRAESEPAAAFALNRDGPAALAKACAGAGVPLIHVSTDQVFDGQLPRAYREDDAVCPISTYGRSKLEGEDAVLAALPQALVVRVSWVFGPHGDNFVAKVLAWARARSELTIVDDQRGRPTYAPDLAGALLVLGRRMLAGGADAPQGVLNIAGADVMTRDDQARRVLAASRQRGGPFATVTGVPTSHFPTPARRGLNAELDVGLAATRYGIRLGGFDADLERTLDGLLGKSS